MTIPICLLLHTLMFLFGMGIYPCRSAQTQVGPLGSTLWVAQVLELVSPARESTHFINTTGVGNSSFHCEI